MEGRILVETVAVGVLALGAGVLFVLMRSARAAADRAAEALLAEARTRTEAARRKALGEAQQALLDRRTAWEAERKALQAAATEREQRLTRLMAHADERQKAMAEREAAAEEAAAALDARAADAGKLEAEARRVRDAQRESLLAQVGMTADEARQHCLKALESAVRHEADARLDRAVHEVEADAEAAGREILHTVLARVRTRASLDPQHHIIRLKPEVFERWFVKSPELLAKLQELTGVEITQEPESQARFNAYDGVWREVAKIVMLESNRRPNLTPETLPAFVQEQEAILTRSLAKVARRFFEKMSLRDLHPDIVKAMGRLRFRTSYGQNILEHSVEAGYIAGLLASEVGLEPALAKRCGLLHDLGKALTTAEGGNHDDLGAELATRCGEHAAVIGAIDGHHGGNQNLYTKLAMAGDAISGARPGARRETYEKYVERINQLQAIASSFPEVQGVDLMKAGREVRVHVPPNGMGDDEVTALAGRVAKRIEDEVIFPGEIHVIAIKETKAVEYAR